MPKPTFAARIADRLVAWRLSLLLVGVVLAVVTFFPARQLDFDQSIESMFAADDPLLPPFRQLQRTFGGNEIVLAAYEDPQLLTTAGIARLADLTRQLEQAPGVAGVLSLANTPLNEKIIDPEDPIAEAFVTLMEDFTVSRDHRTAAVVCILKPFEADDEARRDNIARMREIIAAYPQGVLAGEPVMVVDGFRYLQEDGRLLRVLSLLLVSLTMMICFRSLRWVIIPIAVVQLTLWITEALLVWGRFELSMVSSMLSAVVTIVGVATVVHVIVHFRAQRELGTPPVESMRATLTELAWPIVGACVTDAAGFGSLMLARVGPIQDFGFMAGLGSTLVLLGTALLVPGLALIGRFDADPRRSWGEQHLEFGLNRLIDWVEHRPRVLTVGCVALTVWAVVSASRLEVETDFTKNFRADSPIVHSYEFVESRLGGAGVLDVIVPAPEPLNADFFEQIRTLEDRLRREVMVESSDGPSVPGITKTLSIVDIIDTVLKRVRAIPLLQDRFAITGAERVRRQMPEFYKALLGRDPQQDNRLFVRITMRAKERQEADAKRSIIEQVERISREEFPPLPASSEMDAQPAAQVTGFFVLLTSLIDSVVGDQWLTFAVATAAIGLMMWVAYRSVKLVVIGLIPNALPIYLVLGAMSALGLKINMGTAMIAAVSMGLSVDSSIHYITAYRRLRLAGASLREALDACHQSVGRAMVYSTLALVVGFAALCFSNFVPTIYFGALTSLTTLGGLFGNLVVLPLLLAGVDRAPLQSHPAQISVE